MLALSRISSIRKTQFVVNLHLSGFGGINFQQRDIRINKIRDQIQK